MRDDARRTALQAARQEMEFIEKGNITPLYFTDPAYPHRLIDCIDAPPLLYYRGTADLNAAKVVSVVLCVGIAVSLAGTASSDNM